MNKKINIQICTGTSCYVMGASELLMLEDLLPESIKDNVVITGSPCFGLCCSSGKTHDDVCVCAAGTSGEERFISSGNYSDENRRIKPKPPFVKISGRIIEKADPATVIEIITKELEG